MKAPMSSVGLRLDLQLARRLELAEAHAATRAAEALNRSRPGSASVESIAGGFAVYCGPNSPVTQAVALGLDGTVNDDEFARLEGFYRSRNEPIRVETCPLADSSLIAQFSNHSYRVTEFTNVMARTVSDAASEGRPHVNPQVNIERASPQQSDLWALAVAQGFAESYPVTAELLEVMKVFAQAPETVCYLARIDGKVDGGAALAIRDGIAGLFGASTLPAFRGNGVQTALLKVRLDHAIRARCELAVSLAQPGSSSERNIVRHGFQVLYTRVKFEKEYQREGIDRIAHDAEL